MKKILKLDSQFSIIDGEGVQIMDSLPPGVYELKAAQMRGFWFETMELSAYTGKVYGSHAQMAEKVIRKYASTCGRNLGVLLSGEKGTGKSLFVKNLAIRLSKELPVIVVKKNLGPGMLSVLADVKGRAVLIFDEFEKMFRKDSDESPSKEGDIREQETMLAFFDGVDAHQEKLLLLTVNNTYDLSRYLMGRPGRIYYHFRMNVPQVGEIANYLADNLNPNLGLNLKDIADRLAGRSVSWDCLSAVVSELNSGETMESSLRDLNISSTDEMLVQLAVKAIYDDGEEQVEYRDASADREELALSFRRPRPDKPGRYLWTDVVVDLDSAAPTGSVGEYAAKFVQAATEDDDDNEVRDAPNIVKVLVYRRSFLQSQRSRPAFMSLF